MNIESDGLNDRLLFNEIKSNRHTASGILTDEAGNTFEIEVKGTSLNYVKKFINYQLVKREGNGISTTVKPLSSKEKKALKKASKGNKKSIEESELHTEKSWNGLSVAVRVKELQNKSPVPQKVRITIDPVIEPGESNQMNFTIFGQPVANIECNVSDGKVTTELFEFTNALKTESTSREKAKHITGSKRFDVNKLRTEGNADWNFRVIGELRSTFTISLDLTVL
jgi:hypothetical protein